MWKKINERLRAAPPGKIIKFILIKQEEIGECFDLIYIDDSLCKSGMSTSAVEVLGYLLKMNTDNIGDDRYVEKLKVVSDKLLKYMPDVIAKVIEISENYEKKKCNGEVHRNTLLLKQMYDNLTKKNNQLDFKAPDLGIFDFFKDFQENIITKVILLIFPLPSLLAFFNFPFTYLMPLEVPMAWRYWDNKLVSKCKA